MKKFTVVEIKEIIPENEIHKSFLQRPDIKSLSPSQQQKRWDEHKIALDKFLEQLSHIESFVIET